MKVITRTNIGVVRATNEDAFTYIKKDDNNFLAFVCDGMGGHLGGNYASNKTIEVLSSCYSTFNLSGRANIGVWLFETLQKANDDIYARSLEDANLRGMGTTVSGVLVVNGEIYYAHIGDSRIYVYDEENLQQITTDHTYVNSLLINGLITYKQALKHPKRHVLTNALGIKKDVSVDIGQIKLNAGEHILMCSDGLYNMVDSKKMIKTLGSTKLTVEEKAEDLVKKAIENGGTDNITLIIAE